MAKKKIVKKAQAQQSDRTIQYVVVALALIVLGFIAWPYLPKPKSNVEVGGTPACEIFDSIAAADQYVSAPPLSIDESQPYFATFKMENGGEFVVQLYSDQAPITVNSFVFLACKGFYNGVTFHRVLDGFMAQGGDPTGTGMGDPGYAFEDEFSADLVFDRPGLLAMANSGPNTNGSQFFITYGPTEFLNGKHTIFGEVVQGMDVVNALTRRDPQQNPSFEGDAIESVVITQ